MEHLAIARDAWDAVTHHDKETPVTTPDRPNIFADTAMTLGQISGQLLALGGNSLVARLASEGLGRTLATDDIEHVIAIVAAIEKSRRGPAMPDTTDQVRQEIAREVRLQGERPQRVRQLTTQEVYNRWAEGVPDDAAGSQQVSQVTPSADPSQPQVTA